MTKDKAYQLCNETFISKPVYKIRNSLPAIPIEVSIDACVNDLLVSIKLVLLFVMQKNILLKKPNAKTQRL